MLRNGVGEREQTIIRQDQDAHSGDGLAHGHDLEDRIRPHGRLAFPILIAHS